MRATRNRVYGVTRIGGSNPSSSAILIKNARIVLGVFLSDKSAQTSPKACFHGEGSEFLEKRGKQSFGRVGLTGSHLGKI